MAESDQGKNAPLIIVKRKRRVVVHGGAHGGSWKIAYADFVTAMMAFFLLMWLLMSTNHGTLEGIAEYFNRPITVLFSHGPGTSQAMPEQNTQKNTEKETEKNPTEQQALDDLKTKLQTLIQQNPKLAAFKNQIKIDITKQGLRIQIVDDKDRPMFDVGSTVLKDYTKSILDQIGKTLNDVQNPISITGHTDSLAYSGAVAGYSNWELSSDRANAARRELLVGGMQAKKIIEVRGMSDALPLYKDDLKNPGNRRISIVVLNKEAAANILQQNPSSSVDVGESKPLVLPSSR
jgi:chemotaxis protein MotB